jgi:hypothetical protein
VGLRDGLDDVEERKFFTLPGPELRPLSLYTDWVWGRGCLLNV